MSGTYSANAFALAPASPQAAAISQLFVGTLIYLGAIFALVTFLVLYAIIRYRDRPGAPEARQNFGSRKLEIIWTVVPILSLIVLAGFTVRTMIVSDPPTANADPDLRIVAHQWWWEIYYMKTGVVTANEIHIPAGKRLLVEFRSADVIHDFWAPALGRKIDIVPGHPNRLWIEADQVGTYLGMCAEFCGNEHAWMRFLVIAEPPGQFAAWMKEQLAAPPSPTTADEQLGAKIYHESICTNCHVASVGPDLTHLASRRTLAAGALDNTPENLAAWLRDPDQFKPGSNMPNFELSDDKVRALVAYLETQK
ncbi:MAG: cytochrome c oxidase subunit II [Candidatus Binataceae bacterium]|nr:cytochrome c oxidase subunit II [Candidatus Binataceae bacterium]